MQCDSGFIEDVTIREDSPSSNSEHEESTYDDLDPMIGETIGVRNWLDIKLAKGIAGHFKFIILIEAFFFGLKN